jgi:hypothetical protein
MLTEFRDIFERRSRLISRVLVVADTSKTAADAVTS